MKPETRKPNKLEPVCADCEGAGDALRCAIEIQPPFHRGFCCKGKCDEVRLARNESAKRASDTVSKVSQQRAGQSQSAKNGAESGETGEFVSGGISQEGKHADARTGGELAGRGSARVADDGGGLVEAANPAWAGYVAKNQTLIFNSSCFENGAGDFDKIGPAGGDANEAPMESGEPGVKPRTGGVDLQRDQFHAHRKQWPDGVGLAGSTKRHGCNRRFGFGAVFKACGADGKDRELADLGKEDVANLGIGLDEKEVVGRRRGEPLGDTPTNIGRRHVEFADCAEESGNVLVKNLLGSGGQRGIVLYVDAAAVTELGPAVERELAVSRTDGVGMDAEPAGKFARAGEPVAGTEVSRQDGKHNLRDQLPVDRHFAGG